MRFYLHALAGLCLGAATIAPQTNAQTTAALTLQKTIALPAGSGKFDHLAYDDKAGRLFIAGSSSHTVLVLDANTGKVIETIADLGKPHGLAWVPESGRLFVADGSLAALNVYEGSPFKLVKTIKLSDDADDMAYDPVGKVLYVGHGGGDSVPARVAVIDAVKLDLLANVPMATHPEALEMDAKGRRVFVNVADSNEVAVIDANTHVVTAHWPLKRAGHNVPLAYDEESGFLLVGCRTPAKMLLLDAKSGEEIVDAPSSAGADDLFYNSASHTAYLIAGSGNVDTFEVVGKSQLNSTGSVKTATGAKTGLFVPSIATLFVGKPQAAGQDAAILVYSTMSGVSKTYGK